jgi:hypothetical protein
LNITDAELRSAIKEILRQELTSGDPATRKLLTELLLSFILKDSTGAELSSYIKNLQALVDDTIKGLMRSLGDAGASPANRTGRTALFQLSAIEEHTYDLLGRFDSPAPADTFTTTPLGSNAVYTSPSRDFFYSRLGYACAMGIADQPSQTDGVYAELSLDGVNWDYQGAKATASANVGVALSQEVVARYVRFVWKNGATAQTVFRFGGRYHV